MKPPIVSLALRDCTAEQLASLGLGGYRAFASNGAEIVFVLQPGFDPTPRDIKRAIERANAIAETIAEETADERVDGAPIGTALADDAPPAKETP